MMGLGYDVTGRVLILIKGSARDRNAWHALGVKRLRLKSGPKKFKFD